MTEWHLEEKVYKRWVVLMICPYEELLEELRKVEFTDIDDMTVSAGYNIRLTPDNSKTSHTIVWMPKFDEPNLVHELSHLVMATFSRAGVPITYENEEVFAYYLEYWFREMKRVHRKFPNGQDVKHARG